jgi:hypothetical protein
MRSKTGNQVQRQIIISINLQSHATHHPTPPPLKKIFPPAKKTLKKLKNLASNVVLNVEYRLKRWFFKQTQPDVFKGRDSRTKSGIPAR